MMLSYNNFIIENKSDFRTKFINRSKEIHNNFYNYDKVDYINARTKVIITCPEHGDFYH